MKTFLKPLTSEEEKYYLQEYKRGSQEAKNILIERNLRLVAHIVKKYQGIEEDLDDLISIGTIGLIKAIHTFDQKKSNRLSTYAARCIDNELLMLLRSKKKTSKEVSLYEPIGTDRDGNEINLLDVIENEPVDVVENYTLKEDVHRLYHLIGKILTQRELEVLKLRYGLYGHQELTQREIAKRLNISRSYVSRIEKNAVTKLRSHFFSP
ncbi:MAG: RNA polymerase sporulation sigma factor SigK [Blautia sp.]|nr:RNA polymerase sporulation sigma factor SigK [Blautia sp.]MDY3715419.1 RNA polymerase sporulation sigma factor SigK [Blautia sp.]